MSCNLGAGGHLNEPCYLCHIDRKIHTNDQYGVKNYQNHTDFYDFEKSQSIQLRTVQSYSKNRFGEIPTPLKELIGEDNLESFISPGTLHILLGKNN